MTLEQLNELFLRYLQRFPNDGDIRSHVSKSYEHFERELSECNEYKNLINGERVGAFSTSSERIAILLTGHIRNYNIIETLSNKLQNQPFDVFVHTWDNIGKKGKETNLNDKIEYDTVKRVVYSIPNLKSVIIENNNVFITSLPKSDCKYFNFSSPEPFIKSQLYSIYKTHELMEKYKKENNVQYKAVFKLRFDSIISQFVLSQKLLQDINTMDIIFTSDENAHVHKDSGHGAGCMVCNKMYYDFNLRHPHVFEHSNVICDFYAYGSEKAMKKYCSMYEVYDKMIKEYESVNLKSFETFKHQLSKTENGYTLHDSSNLNKDWMGHLYSFYYFYCSYPERILKDLLKEYMLVKSTLIKVKHVR